MSDQEPSTSKLDDENYEFTSSCAIENLLKANKDEDQELEHINVERPIVLKVVGKQILFHNEIKSSVQYYLSNNVKLYLLEFNMVYNESHYNEVLSSLEQQLYCFKRYDIEEMLRLGNVLHFTNLKFNDEKLDNEDDDELWNKGKFVIYSDIKVKIVGMEPVEEYPEKDSKYLPLWRNFSHVNKEKDRHDHKIFMRAIFLDKISDYLTKYHNDVLDLSRFETLEGQKQESQTFYHLFMEIWIGDSKGFKMPLIIHFNKNNKAHCKRLIELGNCQEAIVTCAKIQRSCSSRGTGFEVYSPEYIVPVTEPKMIRHQEYLNVFLFHDKTNPVQIKKSEPFKNPGWAVNILGLLLPVPSKPAVIKHGRWVDDNLCKCGKPDYWVSTYFQWHSAPLYDNFVATNAGLTHHAVTIDFQCLKCYEKDLILTVEKGKRGIQCFPGEYKNVVKSKIHFKKVIYGEIFKELQKYNKPYDLINSNCQHFAGPFFDEICSTESKGAMEQLIDLELSNLNDKEKCEYEEEYDMGSHKKMVAFVSVSKKSDELSDARHICYVYWFKCCSCQKQLIECAKKDSETGESGSDEAVEHIIFYEDFTKTSIDVKEEIGSFPLWIKLPVDSFLNKFDL